MRRGYEIEFSDRDLLRAAVFRLAPDTFILGPNHAWFRIYEDDPRWFAVQSQIAGNIVSQRTWLEFNRAEESEGRFLFIHARASSSAYPWPSDDFGYLKTTYDPAGGCRTCGDGYVQVAPFRFLPTPKLKRQQAFQPWWVNGEMFVTSALYVEVFKPVGVDFYPVLRAKGSEIDGIVQLKITGTSPLRSRSKIQGGICPECHRTKFLQPTEDYIPEPVSAPAPIFKSEECFGLGGASAYHLLFVTAELYRTLSLVAPRDFAYRPCR